MAAKPVSISLGISGRLGSKKNNNNNHSGPASFAARPAHITQSSPSVAKRGHIRSASLENGVAFSAKNTIGLPAVMGGQQHEDETQQPQQPPIINQTGTLKSRNEQKRMRGQKFGSHSSLDQEALPGGGRTKFQNIRQIFELTKKRTFGGGGAVTSNSTKESNVSSAKAKTTTDVVDGVGSDPQHLTSVLPAAASTANAVMTTSMPSLQLRQQTHQQQLQQPQLNMAYQQHPQLVRKPTPTLMGGNGSGNRSSYSEMSERLSITESLGSAGGGGGGGMSAMDTKQKLRLQQQLQQQQQLVQQQQLQLRQHLQAQRQHSQPQMVQLAHPHLQHQQQKEMDQQHQRRNATSMSHLPHNPTATGQTATTTRSNEGETRQQPKATAAAIDTATTTSIGTTTTTTTPTISVMTSYENLLRPIAFKPIPFEPDYSIQNDNGGRYVAGDVNVAATTTVANGVGDRYGSTPSLAAVQSSNNMRFGSTSDLRHGGVGVATGGIAVGAYSSNNYCNSLMARRRGSRSLKINDSMESIRHTPDSDANSQSSTIKSTGSSNNNNANNVNGINNHGFGGANAGFGCLGSTAVGSGSSHINGFSSGKCMLNEQCDMTPSPSDSGISDLETALKDRDSELSYLRQTMEHNEKVIHKVQKDKESFWEQETKRLKAFYEAQQREYLLKIKKMEQMLAMQQFQFKQHKIRHTDSSNKLKEQMADLKNENEILRSTNTSLRNSERNLRDSVAYIEEQLRESEITIAGIKSQLEESEWKVCERNGELALLKSQLKEANVEITLKEHAIVHLRHENTNAETQIFESLQENEKMTKQQKQVEQQQARCDKQSEIELKQLNKIIILKDQVILALTSELAKLRKELSDLAIFQEYGEEPSGRFIRLKHQLDNLTDICNRTHRQTHKSDSAATARPKEKVIDDTNLELIMNCLKIAQPLDDAEASENERIPAELCAEKRLAKMSADIQNFVYGSHNLPDIAVNHNHTNNNNQHKTAQHSASNMHKLEESTLDTLIEESASYAEEISKLRKQLDDVRVNFELEKRQWCDEREKVLNYQKQLQAHYINMYQKLRSLEHTNEV